MCLNPVKISDVGFVACRECWQCRETRVDDWVGRNIAESKTATASNVVTLTYGQVRSTGHIRAAVLTYSDVQKFLKYLRADGFPVRYFVVGEYGSMKGRAHWHIILYWQGPVPEHKVRENFMERHWPHGWSYWDICTPEAIRYACKYLLKDPVDENHQGWGPMPSKKPPLGHEYFRRLADDYGKQGLSHQELFYSFPDVRRIPNGRRTKTMKSFKESARPVRFRMSGKTAENFLEYFIERWREVYQDEPPRSEAIWAYIDKRLDEYCQAKAEPQFQGHRKGAVPIKPPFEGARVQFCEKANCYYTDAGSRRLWFSFDSEGDAVWHEKIRPDANRSIDLYPSKRVILSENPRAKPKEDSKSSPSAYRQQSRGA